MNPRRNLERRRRAAHRRKVQAILIEKQRGLPVTITPSMFAIQVLYSSSSAIGLFRNATALLSRTLRNAQEGRPRLVYWTPWRQKTTRRKDAASLRRIEELLSFGPPLPKIGVRDLLDGAA